MFCKCAFLSQYETDNPFFRCDVNPLSFLFFAFLYLAAVILQPPPHMVCIAAAEVELLIRKID